MKKSEKKRRFWTKGRAALAAFVFAASALAASSCKSDDTANLSANRAAQTNAGQPKVTVTQQRGAQPQAPPQMETVPAQVWDSEIQSVDGASFRLSDFKD